MNGQRPDGAPDGQHDQLEALAVGWALSALDPDETASFATHLATCDRCARVVEETRAVMGEMASAVPAVPPPPELRARVAAAARVTQQDPPAQGAPRPPERRRRRVPRPAGPPMRRTVVAAALTAVAAGVLGFGVGAVRLGNSGDQPVVAALLDLGPTVVTPVADEDGRQVAAVVAGRDGVQVLTRGLAVNDPAETTYVLWGFRDGRAGALGTFDVSEPEPQLQTVAAGSGDAGFTGYGISLEPGRNAPAAPTDVVATGDEAN